MGVLSDKFCTSVQHLRTDGRVHPCQNQMRKPPATALTAPGIGRSNQEIDVSNHSARRKPVIHPLGIAANRFLRAGDPPDDAEPFDGPYGPICHWFECDQRRYDLLPVCMGHAMTIAGFVHRTLGADRIDRKPQRQPESQAYVYYLMVGPATVKIGTTKNLPMRLTQLRTDLQYVVAIEHGDQKLEAQRHRQFAADRIGRREDFRLSGQLKEHIGALQPSRDDLIALATTYPLHQGVADDRSRDKAG